MKVALVLLCLLEVLDGVFTRWAVTSGVAGEWNPLLVGKVTDVSFVPVKILGAAACVALLWLVSRRFPKIAAISATSVAAFYSLVLVWNVSTLLRP